MSGAVWLASYPKSGNTWARAALYSLRYGGQTVDLSQLSRFANISTTFALMERYLEVETGNLTDAEVAMFRPDFHAAYARSLPEPVPCKIHDAWIRTEDGRPVFDTACTHASIYILRDPRDVAVSWSRFVGCSLEASIARLSNPAAKLPFTRRARTTQLPQPLNTWSEHVTSWVDESGLSPLVLRYEDMLEDMPRALLRMAQRIGWTASEADIQRAVAAAGFDALADQERRFGFSERPEQSERFFRSGRAGQWRDNLTAAQARQIETDHGPVMKRFGYL